MKTIKKGNKGEDVKILQKMLGLTVDGFFGEVTQRSVVDFQRRNSLMPDGIVGDKTWQKLFEKYPVGYKKSKRQIKEIIVHCTATPEGRHTTVEEVTKWHKQNGWNTIGYHYLVYLDGSIHNGRDVDVKGAHCEGHNSYSIGVCYVGGCDKKMRDKDTRTPKQKESLIAILKDLKRLYPNAKIYGHHDFDKGKGCPCFDAKNEYKNL